MKMSLRYYTLGVWCLVFLATQCWSAPANDDRPEIIEIIAPAQAAQETLDSLNLGEPKYEQSERNKRTIGVLRELFPELSKLIDRKVQEITSYLVKTAGPTIISGLLGSGGLFGGGGASGGSTAGSVSGSFSDDDDDDASKTSSESSSSASVSAALPTYSPETSDEDEPGQNPGEGEGIASENDPSSLNARFSKGNTSTDTESSKSEDGPISLKLSVASDATTATSGANPEENQLDGAESQQQEVRVEFNEGLDGDSKVRQARKSEQLEAAASDNNEALDDLTIENADTNEENRDKRLVSFGFGNSASSGGSGGGSGNFLFDIVRDNPSAV